ncbi:MAG: hypothetical protein ACK4GT_03910 [Pararhodobacter sp.]
MSVDERVILVFGGTLIAASMEEFARHRAARLALGLTVLEAGDTRLRVALTGPPDLIDAFEIALSLGPGDCLIHEVWRETNDTTPIAGPGGPQTGMAR